MQRTGSGYRNPAGAVPIYIYSLYVCLRTYIDIYADIRRNYSYYRTIASINQSSADPSMFSTYARQRVKDRISPPCYIYEYLIYNNYWSLSIGHKMIHLILSPISGKLKQRFCLKISEQKAGLKFIINRTNQIFILIYCHYIDKTQHHRIYSSTIYLFFYAFLFFLTNAEQMFRQSIKIRNICINRILNSKISSLQKQWDIVDIIILIICHLFKPYKSWIRTQRCMPACFNI